MHGSRTLEKDWAKVTDMNRGLVLIGMLFGGSIGILFGPGGMILGGLVGALVGYEYEKKLGGDINGY